MDCKTYLEYVIYIIFNIKQYPTFLTTYITVTSDSKSPKLSFLSSYKSFNPSVNPFLVKTSNPYLHYEKKTIVLLELKKRKRIPYKGKKARTLSEKFDKFTLTGTESLMMSGPKSVMRRTSTTTTLTYSFVEPWPRSISKVRPINYDRKNRTTNTFTDPPHSDRNWELYLVCYNFFFGPWSNVTMNLIGRRSVRHDLTLSNDGT